MHTITTIKVRRYTLTIAPRVVVNGEDADVLIDRSDRKAVIGSGRNWSELARRAFAAGLALGRDSKPPIGGLTTNVTTDTAGRFVVQGELARRVREAAAIAGVSPLAWLERAVRDAGKRQAAAARRRKGGPLCR